MYTILKTTFCDSWYVQYAWYPYWNWDAVHYFSGIIYVSSVVAGKTQVKLLITVLLFSSGYKVSAIVNKNKNNSHFSIHRPEREVRTTLWLNTNDASHYWEPPTSTMSLSPLKFPPV